MPINGCGLIEKRKKQSSQYTQSTESVMIGDIKYPVIPLIPAGSTSMTSGGEDLPSSKLNSPAVIQLWTDCERARNELEGFLNQAASDNSSRDFNKLIKQSCIQALKVIRAKVEQCEDNPKNSFIQLEHDERWSKADAATCILSDLCDWREEVWSDTQKSQAINAIDTLIQTSTEQGDDIEWYRQLSHYCHNLLLFPHNFLIRDAVLKLEEQEYIGSPIVQLPAKDWMKYAVLGARNGKDSTLITALSNASASDKGGDENVQSALAFLRKSNIAIIKISVNSTEELIAPMVCRFDCADTPLSERKARVIMSGSGGGITCYIATINGWDAFHISWPLNAEKYPFTATVAADTAQMKRVLKLYSPSNVVVSAHSFGVSRVLHVFADIQIPVVRLLVLSHGRDILSVNTARRLLSGKYKTELNETENVLDRNERLRALYPIQYQGWLQDYSEWYNRIGWETHNGDLVLQLKDRQRMIVINNCDDEYILQPLGSELNARCDTANSNLEVIMVSNAEPIAHCRLVDSQIHFSKGHLNQWSDVKRKDLPSTTLDCDNVVHGMLWLIEHA